MSKVLRLMPDYQCFPLWKTGGEIGNVDPDDLPLTGGLKAALRAWAAAYDATLNLECPQDSPGFASPAEEEAFEAEGRRLWGELQAQLGPEYQVVYHSQREGRVCE